jgi:mitofilin
MAEMAAQSAALRQELDATLLKDLHLLDAPALRTRVAQLAAEFFERTKWEGVRMHQALRLVEAEVSKRYIDLLAQQRAELEVEANKLLQARQEAMYVEASRRSQESILKQEEATNRTLRAQAEGFKGVLDSALKQQEAELRSQLTEEMNHNLALIREGHVQQMLKVQNDMAALQADIAAFHAAADALDASKAMSAKLHKQSAAVMSLETAIKSSQPLTASLAQVRNSCDGDPLVLALLESIPAAVAKTGVPTVSELKARFAVVRGEVRKIALQPEGLPATLGAMVGSGLASVYWAPQGPVKGDGVEEVLSRAAHALDQGRLPEALGELKDIQQPKMQALMRDWLDLAQARLASDQTAVALRSYAIVRHSAISEA